MHVVDAHSWVNGRTFTGTAARLEEQAPFFGFTGTAYGFQADVAAAAFEPFLPSLAVAPGVPFQVERNGPT